MVYFVSIPIPMTMTTPRRAPMVPATDATRYRAILDAAAHIDANPHLYDYADTSMPGDDEHETACMLGRIGALHGGTFGNADEVARTLLGVSPTQFFQEIGRLMLNREPNWHNKVEYAHLHDPRAAAPALRRYADRFRPKHIGLPAVIVDIFNSENEDATV